MCASAVIRPARSPVVGLSLPTGAAEARRARLSERVPQLGLQPDLQRDPQRGHSNWGEHPPESGAYRGGMFRFPRVTSRRPDPAVGSLLAGAMAGGIRDIYGHTVTYVPEDLVYVERLFTELQAEEGFVGDDFTLQSLGCLIGEILVRTDGGHWTAAGRRRGAGDRDDAGLEVLLPNGRSVNPIRAAYDRADRGVDSSVIRFRQVALAS